MVLLGFHFDILHQSETVPDSSIEVYVCQTNKLVFILEVFSSLLKARVNLQHKNIRIPQTKLAI